MAISTINDKLNEPKFYTGTFDLLVFKVILGSSQIGLAVTRKQLGVRRERHSGIWKSMVAVHMFMLGVPLTFYPGPNL